ncbi:MAG: hypothetical protein EB075_03485 [Bacteroidetes bacterium]|nr:hypothetical protein [Bacteroidota bacterium]
MKKDHLEIGAPTPLAPHHAHEPDLAVASDGSIWVTYSRRDRRGDYIVLQQISEQGDVLGSPEIVSDAVGVETQPCLCIIGSELLVTWVAYRSYQWRLLVRSRMIDEPAWGDEIVLEVNPDGVFHPRVSTDTQGNVYLVAERVYGAQAQLMCIARSNLQWGAVALPATSGTIARPDLRRLRPVRGGAVCVLFATHRSGRATHRNLSVRLPPTPTNGVDGPRRPLVDRFCV